MSTKRDLAKRESYFVKMEKETEKITERIRDIIKSREDKPKKIKQLIKLVEYINRDDYEYLDIIREYPAEIAKIIIQLLEYTFIEYQNIEPTVLRIRDEVPLNRLANNDPIEVNRNLNNSQKYRLKVIYDKTKDIEELVSKLPQFVRVYLNYDQKEMISYIKSRHLSEDIYPIIGRTNNVETVSNKSYSRNSSRGTKSKNSRNSTISVKKKYRYTRRRSSSS
jgi:hypothetical protein